MARDLTENNSSKREWLIQVEDRTEGPYSIDELRRHPRFTPDTLVWKKGFKNWVPAKKVSELNKVFKDLGPKTDDEEQEKRMRGVQEVLTATINPSYFLWWLIIILVILGYSIYRLYYYY